jgi:hypothetical protein
MDVLQYVCIDVPSEDTVYWIIYYTLHTHMDVSQYAWLDVSSEDPAQWMIYYTHHRYTHFS